MKKKPSNYDPVLPAKNVFRSIDCTLITQYFLAGTFTDHFWKLQTMTDPVPQFFFVKGIKSKSFRKHTLKLGYSDSKNIFKLSIIEYMQSF